MSFCVNDIDIVCIFLSISGLIVWIFSLVYFYYRLFYQCIPSKQFSHFIKSTGGKIEHCFMNALLKSKLVTPVQQDLVFERLFQEQIVTE